MLLIETVRQVAVASFVFAVLLIRQSRGHCSEQLQFTGLAQYNDLKITKPINPLQTFTSLRDDMECARECMSLVRCSMFAFNELSLSCSLFPAPAFIYDFIALSSSPSPGQRYYAVSTDWCPAKKGFFFDRESELCYYGSQDKRAWNDSETACQELSTGSRLMMLKDTIHREAIARIMDANRYLNSDHLWIGGSDLNPGDGLLKYHWVDGTEIVNPVWNPGEPGGDLTNEFCLSYLLASFSDMRCTNENRYFCAKPK
ncbi:collectin-12-like [Haliotis rufescens]|uniref:collectin-12-like n=1 Tax=Haliotis rufescens TaxID=6454 RepID=UPI00201F5318|nr:collectin-12-like [Haliotis rufescens]